MASNQASSENYGDPNAKWMRFNRVNCLVWVLHESARSFSHAVESLELSGTGPALAMAWVGKDVHEWHKRIAYKLVPKLNLVGEYIENQLNMRQPGLVEWFQEVELPRIARFFLPLLKNWSMEYICRKVDKLHHLATEAGFEMDFLAHFGTKIFPSKRSEELEFWIGLAQKKLSVAFYKENLFSHNKVKADSLATLGLFAYLGKRTRIFLSEMGMSDVDEQVKDFLSYLECGSLVIYLELSSTLVYQLFMEPFHSKAIRYRFARVLASEVKADSLATLGLFAYLGKRTRIFLSEMGMSDVDEQVKDFLSYLECGSLVIYLELSSTLVYQLFMEVVTDEIGWLDFYAAFSCIGNHRRRRSKHSTIQAETEIIRTTFFTLCYDVFSGYAHFSRSTLKPLDTDLLEFLLRSLLTICLEDYWAAYDKSGYVADGFFCLAFPYGYDPTSFVRSKGTINFSLVSKAQRNSCDLMAQEYTTTSVAAKSIPQHESLMRKYSIKLASTRMGTQLLFTDLMVAIELLLNQLRGHRVAERERKRLKRTSNDIASLIPVTILMLLPVSHAPMLAAIQKYIPFLIPSPYSSERLDAVKQLQRTKKMPIQSYSWSNLEDPSSSSRIS
ncbi:hypothetical protein FH972_002116 [Carpinus fangiana]|uniref:Uncharacterized protein n=1 Tax=Carpinus fangiana TaxID=176857 RepID=A0A5N6QH60_9ROSI|nr:hypothetical protein FH972_002116 [Carpinus fangiana]